MPDTPARTAHARLTAAGWRYVAGWLPPEIEWTPAVQDVMALFEDEAARIANTPTPRGRPKKEPKP
jgi:hypothetical protein